MNSGGRGRGLSGPRPARGAVLVTGGAGYVGSHVVLALREAGYADGVFPAPFLAKPGRKKGQRSAENSQPNAPYTASPVSPPVVSGCLDTKMRWSHPVPGPGNADRPGPGGSAKTARSQRSTAWY